MEQENAVSVEQVKRCPKYADIHLDKDFFPPVYLSFHNYNCKMHCFFQGNRPRGNIDNQNAREYDNDPQSRNTK